MSPSTVAQVLRALDNCERAGVGLTLTAEEVALVNQLHAEFSATIGDLTAVASEAVRKNLRLLKDFEESERQGRIAGGE